MSFIKTMIVGMAIFAIILMVMFNVVGSMNVNYGQNKVMDNASEIYLNKVSNFTNNLGNSVNAGDIWQGVPVFGQMIAGGTVAANIFTIAITQVPVMAMSTIEYMFTSMGLKDYIFIFYGIIGALIVLSIMRFLMGREL